MLMQMKTKHLDVLVLTVLPDLVCYREVRLMFVVSPRPFCRLDGITNVYLTDRVLKGLALF